MVCRSENECIGVSTWNLGAIKSCFSFFFFVYNLMFYNICYSSSLRDKLLIINGGLTWEGLVRCLVSFGVDGVGIF
jgi:hypothetical protein